MLKPSSRSCRYCDRPFVTRRNATSCSKSCAAKARQVGQGKPPWTPEEDAVLEVCSGQMPLEDIVKAVQKFNRRHQQPLRTQYAVRTRMLSKGITMNPKDDNFSRLELAKLLKVTRCRVKTWIAFGLRERQIHPKRHAISIADFRRWARKHSDLLGGIDLDRLLWILEDEALAERCSQLPLPVQTPIAVRRKDTGEVFSSLSAAARATYLHYSSIRLALKRDGVCAGISFEEVGE